LVMLAASAAASTQATATPPPNVIDNPDTTFWGYPDTSQLRGESEDPDAVQPLDSMPNPYGCQGRTDRPHLSTSPGADGIVSTHSLSVCLRASPEIALESCR